MPAPDDDQPSRPIAPPPLRLPARRRPLSLLALFGFVLSAMACCPPVSLIGSVLGAMALQRIAFANGALRGRRLARAAMIMGLCFSLAGVLAWWQISGRVHKSMNDSAIAQLQTLVNASGDGQRDAARAAFTKPARARLSDDAILNFGKTARTRFGDLRSVSITSMAPSGVLTSTFEVACTFRFERSDQLGSATFVLEPAVGFSMPIMRLQRVTIDDADAGDLILDPLPSRPATTPAEPASRPD